MSRAGKSCAGKSKASKSSASWAKFLQPGLVREGMRRVSLWMFIGLTRRIQIPKPKKAVSGLFEPGQGGILVPVLGMAALFMELIACDMSVWE